MKKILAFLKSLFSRKPAPIPTPTLPIGNDPVAVTPYEIAKTQVGISERYNKATIAMYHEYAGLKADYSVPWCASFMSYCFAKSSYADQGIKSARAKDWLNVGRPVDHDIQEGDLVIFTRDGGGHIGFASTVHKDHIEVLGGNQDNKVCLKAYPKSRLLGARDYVG